MDVIHLSDLHFGNDDAPFSVEGMAEALSLYVAEHCENPVIVLSGDITFRGRKAGYLQASRFLCLVLKNTGIEGSRVVACPGNHDIVEGSFESFDSFIYGIRKDDRCSFMAKNYQTFEVDNAVFCLLNSSFHLDPKFGLIDDDFLKSAFGDSKDKLKIAVLHHHILNIYKNDTSALRNAYGVIRRFDEEGFNYIFHGHQHAEQSFTLGKSEMKVFSARSGNFMQPGHINGINHYKLDTNNYNCTVKFLGYENDGAMVKVREIN